MGYLGLEPRTYRLKAEYSTIELVTLILTYFFYFVVTPVTSVFTSVSFDLLAIALPVGIALRNQQAIATKSRSCEVFTCWCRQHMRSICRRNQQAKPAYAGRDRNYKVKTNRPFACLLRWKLQSIVSICRRNFVAVAVVSICEAYAGVSNSQQAIVFYSKNYSTKIKIQFTNIFVKILYKNKNLVHLKIKICF
jgi:hypothetical protein